MSILFYLVVSFAALDFNVFNSAISWGGELRFLCALMWATLLVADIVLATCAIIYFRDKGRGKS